SRKAATPLLLERWTKRPKRAGLLHRGDFLTVRSHRETPSKKPHHRPWWRESSAAPSLLFPIFTPWALISGSMAATSISLIPTRRPSHSSDRMASPSLSSCASLLLRFRPCHHLATCVPRVVSDASAATTAAIRVAVAWLDAASTLPFMTTDSRTPIALRHRLCGASLRHNDSASQP